jgi:hypothetical protein
MTSDRPVNDTAWNYLRPVPAVQPYLQMDLLEDGSYECVILDGLPAKVSSNSDNPPSSFRTHDTFIKHPSLPNAWKYLGRIDDRITLVTGEKVLPLPIEQRVRKSMYVKDVLVFGVGKLLPGLLVIPSEACHGMKKTEIIEHIWPNIEEANQNAEGFSQISLDLVEILDVGCSYPATDKGTMIRQACYRQFSDIIEAAYLKLQTGDLAGGGEKLTFDVAELEKFLLELFRNRLGFPEIDIETDFFDAGVDSLRAINARAIIMKEINIGSSELRHNVVFDLSNIEKLSAHLFSLRTGQVEQGDDEIAVMSELIQKYSSFTKHMADTEEVVVSCLLYCIYIFSSYQRCSLMHFLIAINWGDWIVGSFSLIKIDDKGFCQANLLSCTGTLSQ